MEEINASKRELEEKRRILEEKKRQLDELRRKELEEEQRIEQVSYNMQLKGLYLAYNAFRIKYRRRNKL
jgi:hypothetical protein